MTVPIDISKIDIITDNDINGEVSTDNNPYCDTDYGKIHLYELYTVLNDILVE